MTADTIGGVWNYALELAGILGQHGVEVALATMGKPLSSQQWESVREVANLQVFESVFKLEWMDNPWEEVQQAGEWLLDLEKQLKPDLLHLNNYVHAALAWEVPTLVVGHSCVLSWWEAVKGEAAPASWTRYQREVREGLEAANLVVAPSTAMLEALERHYGALGNKKMIPNGRDSTVFYPRQKEPIILAAGRLWDEAKNVAVLEEVASQVEWGIYLAGEEKFLQNQLQQQGEVVRLGRLSQPELAEWYGRAAIYALPAKYEPFGLSVLEAALSGCALVLGDIPSLREIWGDAAMFVLPDNRDAIAHTLNTLIHDVSLRTTLAEKARRRALEFTPQRMVSGYLEAYRELLA